MKDKIQFYRTLATLTDAGVPILKALSQTFQGKFRNVGRDLAVKMEKEQLSLSDAMMEFQHIFSFLETQLVAAGEYTGKLPVIFNALADIYEFRLRLIKNIIADMLYPALVYHVAAVLIPLISILLDSHTSVNMVILKIFAFLMPPYIIIFFIYILKFLDKRLHITLPEICSRIALNIPFLKTIITGLNYSRFFYILGFCLKAGVPITYAIHISANSVTNKYLQHIFASAADSIEKTGCAFTEILRESVPYFERDSIIFPLLETGEMSGTMDDACSNIANIYREKTEGILKLIGKILPKLIYFAMIVYIALTILSFWSKLFAKTANL